jgi:hypothetical protein
MVTKLRAKLSSDVVRGSGCGVGFRVWSIERLSKPVSMVGAAVEKRKYIQNEAGCAEVNDMRGFLTGNSPVGAKLGDATRPGVAGKCEQYRRQSNQRAAKSCSGLWLVPQCVPRERVVIKN